MNSILGVIPARGGSKRLPRKNIKLLNGKPLIEYTISAANKSEMLTDYIFTTDDPEILDVAQRVGANSLILRPEHLATDKVRNSATMIHALEHMEKSYGKKYDAVMLLQPTAPFRTHQHIDEAISLYNTCGVDSLASVKGPFKKRDINLKYIENGKLKNLISVNREYFIYNAAIYIIKKKILCESQSFISENECAYLMDTISSIDIDDEFDFLVAQAAIQFKEDKECLQK